MTTAQLTPPKSNLPIHQKRYLVWGALVLFGLAAMIVIFLLMGANQIPSISPHVLGQVFEIEAALLGIWLAILVVLWTNCRGSFDPFEPPLWMSANAYGQVILNVWWLQREHILDIPWSPGNYDNLLFRTLLLFGVGLTAFWVGYTWNYSRLKNKIAAHPRSFATMRSSVVYLVWLFGWVTSFLSALLGVTSYLGTGTVRVFANYFFFVDLLYLLSTCVIVVTHFRKPTWFGWLWLGIFITSEIFSSLIVGTKTFALTLIFLMMCIYYANRKLSYQFFVWGGFSLLIILAFVPVIMNYRSALQSSNRGSINISDRVDALGVAIEKSISSPLTSLLDSTSSTLKVRQGSVLDITASTMYLHPDYLPFVGKEMIDYFVQLLIPRAIWSNKPAERPQIYMITTIYAGRSSEYTFSDIGLFADSFRAGGWPAVMIFLGMLGALSARLYLKGPGARNLAGLAFYIVVLNELLRYDFPVVTLLIYLVEFGTLLWLVVTFVMFKSHPNIQA